MEKSQKLYKKLLNPFLELILTNKSTQNQLEEKAEYSKQQSMKCDGEKENGFCGK